MRRLVRTLRLFTNIESYSYRLIAACPALTSLSVEGCREVGLALIRGLEFPKAQLRGLSLIIEIHECTNEVATRAMVDRGVSEVMRRIKSHVDFLSKGMPETKMGTASLS